MSDETPKDRSKLIDIFQARLLPPSSRRLPTREFEYDLGWFGGYIRPITAVTDGHVWSFTDCDVWDAFQRARFDVVLNGTTESGAEWAVSKSGLIGARLAEESTDHAAATTDVLTTINLLLLWAYLGGQDVSELGAGDLASLTNTGTEMRVASYSSFKGDQGWTASIELARRAELTDLLRPAAVIPPSSLQEGISRGAEVERAYRECPAKERVPLPLLLTAHTCARLEQWNAAFLLAWTLLEAFLGRLWEQRVVEPAQGRRAGLRNYRTWTASTQIELLRQINVLPPEVAEVLDSLRKTRNKIVHDGRAADFTLYRRAVGKVEWFLSLEPGPPLTLPPIRPPELVSAGRRSRFDLPDLLDDQESRLVVELLRQHDLENAARLADISNGQDVAQSIINKLGVSTLGEALDVILVSMLPEEHAQAADAHRGMIQAVLTEAEAVLTEEE